VLLVACVVAQFWKIVFTSWMLYFRDILNYTYPHARLIHSLCRQGMLPYWNPYLNYGQPVLANPNFLFFYPSTLLLILFPAAKVYNLQYVAHFALAGVGAYLLARRWGQSTLAAFFAGFVFVFSGPVVSLGNLNNELACVAWMPWALLATEQALEKRGLRPWILLVLVFSLQNLAGEPFTLIATFALAFAYALYRKGNRHALGSKSNLEVLAAFFLVGTLMLALCAVQFLPSGDFLSHSRRGIVGLSFRDTTHWSLHPLSLLGILIPEFFGGTIDSLTSWGWMMGDNDAPYLTTAFVGFVPLFFALCGWALSRDRRRHFAAAAALVLLLIAFGHFTPVFSLAYLLVPFLQLLRYPVKLLIPVLLLVALLAGWGLDALRDASNVWAARRRRVLAPLQGLLGVVVAVLFLTLIAPALIAEPVRQFLISTHHDPEEIREMITYLVTILRLYLPGLAGFLLGGWLLVISLERRKAGARAALSVAALLGMGQLALVNYSANPSAPQRLFTFRPPVLSYFQDPPGTYRFTSGVLPNYAPAGAPALQGFVDLQPFPEAKGLPPLAYGVFRERLLLSMGSMLNDVEGSLNIDIERSLPPYLYELWIYIMKQAPNATRVDCLFGRTNVKYQIKRDREASPVTRLLAEIPNGSPQPSYLYENLYVLPRAYVAGNTRFSTEALATLNLLSSTDFDAPYTVILAAPPGEGPELHSSGVPGRVFILSQQPNTVVLRAELSQPGYVVLLDRYDPNWHATVDGREVRVFRANQLFRAVYAGPGRHEIRFEYRQWGLVTGTAITLLAAALLAGLYVFNPLRQRTAGAA